jgi:hypothetical protein
MSYAKSLRVIGQTLEAARVATFEVEKSGPCYFVTIGDRLFCFSPADISRLNAQAQKRRQNQSSSIARLSKRLSHQLRTLGDHLDRIKVSAFHIVWTAGSVILDYQPLDGQRNCRTFTADELRQLCLHRRLPRSSSSPFPQLDI